jgi:uncharacterized repeat protein (TIGR03806 family)
MHQLQKIIKMAVVIGIFMTTILLYPSCQKDKLISTDETVLIFNKLSSYHIYQGNPSDLNPNPEYKLYELSSSLFTDDAEKQRLIKLPPNTKMDALNNDLINFPEGTIIVKTFFYYKNKQRPSSGKKLIETRILQLIKGKWIAGTYVWNESQTEADLISTGLNKTVNWINQDGQARVISYHIPSNLECKTCHNANKSVIPIGPKVRNLNFNVYRNNLEINQLKYFQNQGILNPVNPDDFSSMVNYNDEQFPLEKRARAYLDINCAHCHKEDGFAAKIRYRLQYDLDLNSTKIKEGKAAIKYMMENGDMPKIGTTTIDEKGVELVKKYIQSL